MAELKLLNSLVDGRYEILERKSIGSYSEIFIARDRKQRDQLVIIKALNTQLQGTLETELEQLLIENFYNEAEVLDRLDHSNIIKRLDQGSAIDLNGVPFYYLILEYLPGGDLLQRCKAKRLSICEMLGYLRQICDALAYAHARNVIHRDIKPNNLLLSTDATIVKIADFGVAKINNRSLDKEVTRVGSNTYAPPEHHPSAQLDNVAAANQLTPSADIYSLAKTVYTLISVRAPFQFEGKPISYLPIEIRYEPWASGLLRVLCQATSSDISARFSSAQEFYQAIETVWQESEEITRVRPSTTRLAELAELNSANSAIPVGFARDEAKIVVPLASNSQLAINDKNNNKKYLSLLAIALVLMLSFFAYSYYPFWQVDHKTTAEDEVKDQPMKDVSHIALPSSSSIKDTKETKELIRAKQSERNDQTEVKEQSTIKSKPEPKPELDHTQINISKETDHKTHNIIPVQVSTKETKETPTVAIPTPAPTVAPNEIPVKESLPLPKTSPEHLPPAPAPKGVRELPKVPKNGDEPLPDSEKNLIEKDQ